MNPYWQAIATFIIRKRIPILVGLGAVIYFMWTVRGTELVHRVADILLTDKAELAGYQKFRSYFGDDANVMVASLEGNVFDSARFVGLYDLTNKLTEQEGVVSVVSLTRLYDIVSKEDHFEMRPLVPKRPESQAEIDSIKTRFQELVFYEGLLWNDSTQNTLIAVSFNDSLLDTDRKIDLLYGAQAPIEKYAEQFDIDPHFAGMPVLRVNMHDTIKKELVLFLVLAMVVTAITLLLFFRSVYMMIFPMVVVGCVVIFSLGLIGLFGYKMSLITGVIPALVVVIGIPNSVYLITKYHIEFRRTGNKMKALILVIEKIGIVTIMTNATTAVGLGVLSLTDIKPLREFGIVAGLSVIAAFFISLLLIPIVLSFLPPPTASQTRHLDRSVLDFVIRTLDRLVLHNRRLVYVVTSIVAGLSLWGMSMVVPVAYMVDDVPQDSKLLRDLRYIEDRFNGALPFEILIDTKKPDGVLKRSTLRDIAQLQDSLAKYPQLSRSISVADIAKFLNQALFGVTPEFYDLPLRMHTPAIQLRVRKTQFFGSFSISKTLADSNMQVCRVSATVRDIGSIEMEKLIDSVRKDVNQIFDTARYETAVTGTPQVFIKGNEALVDNLLWSLMLAFMIIAVIMGILFRSGRMVIISLTPNVLPLIMVAGIMGFFGIALKPSTALVFGVAFGIAVDDSIHFLARYRLARRMGDTVREAVSHSFLDTGVSMIYTSIILFFGFVSFTLSDFGGTKMLGLLTSITLGIAMFSNLVLLPSLLIAFGRDNSPPTDNQTSETPSAVRIDS